MVSLDERNLSVLQRLNPRCKGELRRDIQRSDPVGIDAVLLREIKVSLHTGEANDLISLLDGLEGALPRLGILVKPHDILGQERILNVVAERCNADFTLQDALDIVGSKDLRTARESDRRTRTHDSGSRRRNDGRRWTRSDGDRHGLRR